MEEKIILDEERIEQIALEYMVKKSKVKKYLRKLMDYSFIVNGDEDKMYACLEAIVFDLCNKKDVAKVCNRTLKESIPEMIFRVYGYEAFQYLNEEFLRSHNVSFCDVEDVYEDEYGEAECVYQGISYGARKR